MYCEGIAPPTTSSTNSKPCAAIERLDAQIHLAELAGAAGLFLVAVMTFGRARDRLAIGNARRVRLAAHAVALAHAIEQHAQMQIAHAVEHGLVQARVMLDAHARIFGDELVQSVRELLFFAAPLGLDREPGHRRRERDRLQVIVVLVVRVVQHRVEVQLVDLRHRADVAGNRVRDLRVLLALQLVQVRDLERLARIADEQLRAGAHRALMHAKHAEPADERIDVHLEHVRDHVLVGSGVDLDALGLRALRLSGTAADCLPADSASAARRHRAAP